MSTEASSFFSLTILSSEGQSIATVLLNCGPDGGTHPRPEAACKQLSTVDGRIEDIPPINKACPFIFDPVTVTAVGIWKGSQRFYQREFSNKCVAVRETGGVIFDFG